MYTGIKNRLSRCLLCLVTAAAAKILENPTVNFFFFGLCACWFRTSALGAASCQPVLARGTKATTSLTVTAGTCLSGKIWTVVSLRIGTEGPRKVWTLCSCDGTISSLQFGASVPSRTWANISIKKGCGLLAVRAFTVATLESTSSSASLPVTCSGSIY